MKKIFIFLLITVLFLFGGCAKKVTVTFMIDGQTAFQVEGKAPLYLNENDFQINDKMLTLNRWTYEHGSTVDFSKPFNEDTIIFGDVNYSYQVNWQVNGEIIQKDIVKDNQQLILPERIPTIDGYIFTGWLDSAGINAQDYTFVKKDTTFVAHYEATMEKIIVVNDTLVFSGPDAPWQRAGVTDNMGYDLTFTPSNPEVATYYDTHIFPHQSGTCVFTITSASGIVKYLTVIVQ
ncbi:MAG: InlB B-repeat-containing protein [Erysipelotrichia bacterium]|nr:InlB B-repeat-containing protein [Erysipelotrichia bacterium]